MHLHATSMVSDGAHTGCHGAHTGLHTSPLLLITAHTGDIMVYALCVGTHNGHLMVRSMVSHLSAWYEYWMQGVEHAVYLWRPCSTGEVRWSEVRYEVKGIIPTGEVQVR